MPLNKSVHSKTSNPQFTDEENNEMEQNCMQMQFTMFCIYLS